MIKMLELVNKERILFALFLIIAINFFKYKPRKGGELYSGVIANRGLHIFSPENSLAAFKYATRAKLVVSIDVRQTKDGKLVCFHDKYTKRLLGIPGKISMLTYDTIRKFKLSENNERVPLLSTALLVVNGEVPVLLKIKGKMTKQYLDEIDRLVKRYKGKVYFETRYIIAYHALKARYKYENEKRVYYILNPFRKRPQYIRAKDYVYQRSKFYGLSKECKTKLPTAEDVSSIIVRNIESLENKKEILATIGKTINRYETRVGDDHWVKESLWLHRSIVSKQYPEHSRESFIACLEFANKYKLNLTLEFDVILYKGEVKCYHNDKLPSILGQSASCAKKLDIEETLTLREILEIVSGKPNINIAIDIKDYGLKNRELEDLIIKELEESNYAGNFILMSFNPMVLNYFKKVRPDWLRAQVVHSLNGLRQKVPFFRFPWVINGFFGVLLDLADSDCIVMDNSNWLYYLISFHRNVQGKPVLIYAPKSYVEQEAFVGRDSVTNFIVENIESNEDWPREYIYKFCKKDAI